MEKTRKLTMLLLAVTVLGFIGCDDKEDRIMSNHDIILGSWTWLQTDYKVMKDTITFHSDGTFSDKIGINNHKKYYIVNDSVLDIGGMYFNYTIDINNTDTILTLYNYFDGTLTAVIKDIPFIKI